MTDLKVTNVAPVAPAANTTTPPAQSNEVTGAVNAPPAGGCGTGKVLFEDAFNDHDPMWGPKSSELTISGGQAVFDPAPGTPTLRWNRVFVFGDLDACASVRIAKETSDPTASYAGLIFWVQDSRNYYQAVIAPNGYFTVARIVDGKAVAKRPVEWKKIAASRPAPRRRTLCA